jgi:hypothetical protein
LFHKINFSFLFLLIIDNSFSWSRIKFPFFENYFDFFWWIIQEIKLQLISSIFSERFNEVWKILILKMKLNIIFDGNHQNLKFNLTDCKIIQNVDSCQYVLIIESSYFFE